MLARDSVPLLVGIVGSEHDAAASSRALIATVEALAGEARERYPHTPLAVLSTGQGAPAAAAVDAARKAGAEIIARSDPDARESIAWACDLLVVVAGGPAPPDLLALVDRRRFGAEKRPDKLLAPADVGACFLIEGEDVQRYFPPRFRGDTDAEKAFDEALRRRDRFNADLGEVPQPHDGTPIERLRTRTAAVTRVLQQRTMFWQRALYAFAFLAACAQIVPIGLAGVYVRYGAVAIAFLTYVIVRRRDYQSRYQDYRAISEALRVQAVWSAIGIAESVDAGYLPMQQTNLQWIRSILRCAYVLEGREATQGGMRRVVDWVTVERRYFDEHSRSEARGNAVFSNGAMVLAAVSVLSSLAIIVEDISHVSGAVRPFVPDIGAAASCAALSVALARSYAKTRGYSENANRYRRMFLVFDRALAVLTAGQPADGELAREVARELGRVALAEHAEWLLWQRERPIAMVETSAA